MLKKYAIESVNRFSENKYCLIKELWLGGVMVRFDYEHSNLLPEGWTLVGFKKEFAAQKYTDSINLQNGEDNAST